jgi:hypothetical protein
MYIPRRLDPHEISVSSRHEDKGRSRPLFHENPSNGKELDTYVNYNTIKPVTVLSLSDTMRAPENGFTCIQRRSQGERMDRSRNICINWGTQSHVTSNSRGPRI